MGQRSRKVGHLLRDTLIDTSILVCQFDVSCWRDTLSSEELAKKVVKNVNLGWERNFLGTNFPKIFAVDSRPLKPSNVWQNLVGLGSVAFVWETRQ